MIAIVTDSAAYITRREAKAYGIKIVPQRVYDGLKYNYETYIDEMHATVEAGANTKSPDAECFEQVYKSLIEKGADIICITTTSKLSNTYFDAVIATKKFPEAKISVIDSRSTAGGIFLIAKRARYLANIGLSHDEITMKLYKYAQDIKVYFSVEETSPLRLSKRLAHVGKSIGAYLNRIPLFSLKGGRITYEKTTMGNADLIKSVIKRIPNGAKHIIFHYVFFGGKQERIYEILKKRYPASQVQRRPLGPVLIAKMGRTVLGFVHD